MIRHKTRWLSVFAVLMLLPVGFPQASSHAQGNSRIFPETGKTVSGRFLDYWNRNGGLAQQGFPISEEFTEVSDLDGKPYKVQYFERAVFEQHPENQPPYNVLLSQLGKFRYLARYSAGAPRPTQPPVPPAPTTGPRPQPTTAPPPPPPPASGCDVSGNRNGVTDKTVVRAGQSIKILVGGFTPSEPVSFWFTLPTGDVIGTARPLPPEAGAVNPDGTIGPFEQPIPTEAAAFQGRWAMTFQGAYSNNTAVVYFCVIP